MKATPSLESIKRSMPPLGAAAGQRDFEAGRRFARQRRWVDAAKCFTRASRVLPDDALVWTNLANAERNMGALDRAEAAARHALQADATDPLALQVLGETLARMHRYAESVDVFAQLEQNGTLEPDVLLRQASMLHALQRPLEAVPVLLRALAARPHLLRGHAQLADAFRDLDMKREAVECMKTVLALEPGNLEALSHLSFEKRHLADWGDWDADLQRIEDCLTPSDAGADADTDTDTGAGAGADADAVSPRVAACLALLSLPLDPTLQLRAARGETAALTVGVTPLPPLSAAERRARAVPGRVPRIGWVSYDFREHPVAQLIVEMLEHIDRTRFQTHLYSSGPDDQTALRSRTMQAADHFTDLRGLSDHQAAQRMRDDGVDILIDLNGLTRGHRVGLLAARAAPLQVSFLGYPGSSGAGFIDYLIGDPLVTPLELAAHYSEKLAQLPLTLQPNGRWRPLPQAMGRAQAGLPDGAFVLCAFNHTYKILPAALDAWCELLRDIPHAVLWLKETNSQLRHNLLRECAARGVAAERIVFAQAVSYADHFSRLALADVFVDTWPYNAHTTAADALWAGLPVVTLYGNAYASRVAASVLNAAGLSELAFGDVADYKNAVRALAQDAALLAGYRHHLQSQRLALPLFNTPRYALEMQALLQRMLARWHAGLGAEHLPAE